MSVKGKGVVVEKNVVPAATEESNRVIHIYTHLRNTLIEYAGKNYSTPGFEAVYDTIDKIHEDIKRDMKAEVNKFRGR